jgi:hypothetical protein
MGLGAEAQLLIPHHRLSRSGAVGRLLVVGVGDGLRSPGKREQQEGLGEADRPFRAGRRLDQPSSTARRREVTTLAYLPLGPIV